LQRRIAVVEKANAELPEHVELAGLVTWPLIEHP
jgi:hypothetical protein